MSSDSEPLTSGQQATEIVLTETRGTNFVVTINRPEVRNAIDGPTAAALVRAFRAFEADDALAGAIKDKIVELLGKPLRPAAVRFVAQTPQTRNAKLLLRVNRGAHLGKPTLGALPSLARPRQSPGQDPPQAILGGALLFLGVQAALLDRRLVARDDQLGFPRIEDVRRRQSGGVLAAPVEDGLGAAIGEKVFSVADAFDNQRDRDVVDDQFKKLLGIFEFLGT